MKKTLLLFLLTASIGAARAQDAYDNSDYAPADTAAPSVVYEAPVTYAGPVVYQAPVVYYGPVFYGTPVGYALNACSACEDTAIQSTVTYIGRGVRYQVSPQCVNNRSTVTYIGGAQTGFQVSPRCNYGSTVTFIGSSWYASH
jgi:hypothetical protein